MDGVRRLTLRQQWRDFIVDPQTAGRHLASIGSAVLSEPAPILQNPVIEQFLTRLAGGTTDVRFLAAIVDLLTHDYDFSVPKHCLDFWTR